MGLGEQRGLLHVGQLCWYSHFPPVIHWLPVLLGPPVNLGAAGRKFVGAPCWQFTQRLNCLPNCASPQPLFCCARVLKSHS